MRTIVSNTLRTFGLLTMAVGVLLVSISFDLTLWRDGRLTDLACYLIIAPFFPATFWLWRLDHRVRTGKVDPTTLPRILQDPSDFR